MQHLALGSVVYIFALTSFIWLILIPFKLARCHYFTVLTFTRLTSFPAIFYAIPVDKFLPMQTSNNINV